MILTERIFHTYYRTTNFRPIAFFGKRSEAVACELCIQFSLNESVIFFMTGLSEGWFLTVVKKKTTTEFYFRIRAQTVKFLPTILQIFWRYLDIHLFSSDSHLNKGLFFLCDITVDIQELFIKHISNSIKQALFDAFYWDYQSQRKFSAYYA